MSNGNLDPGLTELFRQEAATHTEALSSGLLAWEDDMSNLEKIEPLMRSAHSLKGAARIVGLTRYSQLAHVLEDCFVAAQNQSITLHEDHYDIFLDAVEFLGSVQNLTDDELAQWPGNEEGRYKQIEDSISSINSGQSPTPQKEPEPTPKADSPTQEDPPTTEETTNPAILVFNNQALAECKRLHEALESIKHNPLQDKNFPPLITAAQSIKAAAMVAELNDIMDVASSLETLLTSALESGKIDEAELNQCIDAVQTIKATADGTATQEPLTTDGSDPALIAVFTNQLQIQAPILRNELNAMVDAPTGEKDYSTLLSAAEAIQGTASIAELPQAADTAKNLFDILTTAQEKGLTLDPDTLQQCLSLLSDLENTTQEPSSSPKESLVSDGSDPALLEVLANQLDSQLPTLKQYIGALEGAPTGETDFSPILSAIDAILGTATIAEQPQVVTLASSLKETFTLAQSTNKNPDKPTIKESLKSLSILETLAQEAHTQPQAPTPTPTPPKEEPAPPKNTPEDPPKPTPPQEPSKQKFSAKEPKLEPKPASASEIQNVRISAGNLNRMMALAAESLIETRRLTPLKQGLLHLKSIHQQAVNIVHHLHTGTTKSGEKMTIDDALEQVSDNDRMFRFVLQDQLDLFEEFSRNNSLLSSRLYNEILSSRMRPLREGVKGFPLLVRNLARSLNKKIAIQIDGQDTPVDRDILEKLDAPLNHIIRNACDHGLESPEDRQAAGKDTKGNIHIQAYHSAGMLLITISDDGKGIDKEYLRNKILKKELLTAEMAATLSDEELFDFLFLPGFSTAEKVTEISGRGVGLDVVRNLMQEIGGNVRVHSTLGQGTTFYLHLPITRSVLRALMVEINGEPYAFPLNRINRTLQVLPTSVQTLEKREYFHYDNNNIAMVCARQTLGFSKKQQSDQNRIPVVILGEKDNLYSLVVDQLLGETELVVRPIDPRLGKVPCISAASITEEGSPVLIIDVDDVMKSMDKTLSGSSNSDIYPKHKINKPKTKSVLVVDDSITVRETERQLLEAAGYKVTLALDGADGWNTLRSSKFDLIVTDIDMPRMNGFELLEHIKNDSSHSQTPVIIVSYKDREEDRNRASQLGASYFLTKSAFRDQTFINVVKDLIGEPLS